MMSSTDNIKNYIRDIDNFPEHGVLFRDITPLLRAPKAFDEVLDNLEKQISASLCDIVAGIESRGFIFAAPIASRLRLPFVPIRKPGKLPSDKLSVAYELEYGSGQLEIHKDAIAKGQKVFLVDDILATGGTLAAAASLVKSSGGDLVGAGVVIELTELNGRNMAGIDDLYYMIKY